MTWVGTLYANNRAESRLKTHEDYQLGRWSDTVGLALDYNSNPIKLQFHKNIPTNAQVRTAAWTTHWCNNIQLYCTKSGTSVIRRSRMQSHARFGPRPTDCSWTRLKFNGNCTMIICVYRTQSLLVMAIQITHQQEISTRDEHNLNCSQWWH